MSPPASTKETQRDLKRFFVENQAAIVIAVAISCVFSVASLAIPPALFADPGYGFAAWHGTLQNHFNSIVQPDPADISKDAIAFLAAWSPGQYLIPGILALLGLKLGDAIIVVVAACSLSWAIGWLKVLTRFIAVSDYIAISFVIVLLTARYATLPYGIYDGGEILLQGLLPWLTLWSFDIPINKPEVSALAAFLFTLVAFVAKLSGLIVMGVLVCASALTFFLTRRKLNWSSIAAGIGTLAAIALVYHLYIAKGWTAMSGSEWRLSPSRFIAPFVLPWFSSLSLDDALSFLLQNPHHMLMRDVGYNVLIIAPFAFAALFLYWRWRPQSEQTYALKLFTGIYFALNGLIFLELFLHGGIDLEERHFRLTGLLFLTCAFVAVYERNHARKLYLLLPLLASLYGLASFVVHTAANMTTTETYSWTAQPSADRNAIKFLQQAFQREGRSSIFVLTSADQEVTLPYQARILPLEIDFTPLSNLPTSYQGKIPGKIYVIISDKLAMSEKAQRVISAFKDYHNSHRMRFGNTSVFVLG